MNTKQRFRPGRCLFYVTGAILTYVLCGAARGQVSEQYDLSWSVLSGGGGVCVSGANSIQDAVGRRRIRQRDLPYRGRFHRDPGRHNWGYGTSGGCE